MKHVAHVASVASEPHHVVDVALPAASVEGHVEKGWSQTLALDWRRSMRREPTTPRRRRRESSSQTNKAKTKTSTCSTNASPWSSSSSSSSSSKQMPKTNAKTKRGRANQLQLRGDYSPSRLLRKRNICFILLSGALWISPALLSINLSQGLKNISVF